MTRPVVRRRHARGFTLVEVLVAILLFTIGVLGLAAMQAKLFQVSTQNTDRARAALLADDLVTTALTQKKLALSSQDVDAWVGRVGDASASGLTDGQGSYQVTGNVGTVTVTWMAAGAAAGATRDSYVTTVVIP